MSSSTYGLTSAEVKNLNKKGLEEEKNKKNNNTPLSVVSMSTTGSMKDTLSNSGSTHTGLKSDLSGNKSISGTSLNTMSTGSSGRSSGGASPDDREESEHLLKAIELDERIKTV